MSERAASQPPPPSLPLEELAHSDEAYILLLVRRGLLLPDTTKTWHFNLLPVTSLVPLGGFSRAPSYHLLVGKNTFRKSCSLALLLQEGQEKQEERRSSGRRLWLRTQQATSPAKPSNGRGGGRSPAPFLFPSNYFPKHQEVTTAAPVQTGARDFFSNSSPQGLHLKERGCVHPVITKAGGTAI